MNSIFTKLVCTLASAAVLAIVGSVSKAQAYQYFSDRNQWEAALSSTPTTYNFGADRVVSSESPSPTTVFPNGISIGGSRGGLQVEGGGSTLTYFSTGDQFEPGVDLTLPSAVTALGLNISSTYFFGRVTTNHFYGGFTTQTSAFIRHGFLLDNSFFGVISNPGDPLITGFDASYYDPYIESVSIGNISSVPSTPVPEPTTVAGLLAFAGVGVVSVMRRKKALVS